MANSGCNGVIVGSTFVKYIQDNINEQRFTTKFRQFSKKFYRRIKIVWSIG